MFTQLSRRRYTVSREKEVQGHCTRSKGRFGGTVVKFVDIQMVQTNTVKSIRDSVTSKRGDTRNEGRPGSDRLRNSRCKIDC